MKSRKDANLRSKLTFLVILLFVNCGLSKSTHAADWFVNKACSTGCDGTSWSQGWNELNQVRWGAGGVQPGDTLWISGRSSGQTYTTQLSPDINGLPGQSIYIKPGAAHSTQSSGHDGLVTISVPNDHCVTIYRSYITIDGRGKTEGDKKISITSCGKNGVSAGSDAHHIEIFNLSIWNTPAADTGNSATNCAIAFGAESPPAGQLIAEIKGNDIKHPYEYGIWAHGPITSSQYGLILIHDNEIYDFPGEDYLWASRGVDVYHNIIRGPKASTNKEGFHADGIVAMGSYVRIFNNLIYDLQPGPAVQSGMGSYIYLNPFTPVPNTSSCCMRVMNNLIYESRPPQYASQVKHNGINYRVADSGGTHFSSMDTEPGVGSNWMKYWEIGGTGTEPWIPDTWYYGNLYNRGLEASWQTGSEGSWSSISWEYITRFTEEESWTYGGPWCYSYWTPNTNYSVGDKRQPQHYNGYYYQVTADNGVSGSLEPNWPTTLNGDVNDGGLVWTNTGVAPCPKITTWPANDQVTNSFIWNNFINGASNSLVNLQMTTADGNGYDDVIIQKDRDFFLHEPQVSGGKTYYVLNSQCTSSGAPASCCTGNGTGHCSAGHFDALVYTASGPNAYYPYTPYTCPHPLTGLTGTCDPTLAGISGYNISDTAPPGPPTGLIVR